MISSNTHIQIHILIIFHYRKSILLAIKAIDLEYLSFFLSLMFKTISKSGQLCQTHFTASTSSTLAQAITILFLKYCYYPLFSLSSFSSCPRQQPEYSSAHKPSSLSRHAKHTPASRPGAGLLPHCCRLLPKCHPIRQALPLHLTPHLHS